MNAVPRIALAAMAGLFLVSGADFASEQTSDASSAHVKAVPTLAALVAEGKGTLTVAIREAVADQDDILTVDWPLGAAPHHATTLYSFADLGLSVEKFMTLVRFKPEMVISTEYDEENSVPSVEMGATYEALTDGLQLVVTEITPAWFRVVDQSGEHAGSVVFGAFTDSAGELWLFEERVGEFFTSSSFFGIHDERLVEPTRNFIKAAKTLYIDDAASGSDESAGGASSGPCPARYQASYVVGVNHHVDTDITVHKGDVVTLKASGTVTLGFFAGDAGPEGIDFNPAYSYFPDSPHGCLIGRVRTATDDDEADPWAYVGAGDTWNIKDDGYLQFNLNDNDPDNNVGEIRVEIRVCRRH